MKRVILWSVLLTGVLLFLVSCGSNAFKSVSDENSDEACRYKTTQNLDSRNYDAVLSSTCADSMQKGAAYFGKAGYDIKDVINNLSTAQDKTDPLTLYMSSLTGIVTDSTLTNLDNARTEYTKITTTSTNYKDAQFYISLVDSVKSLSLMKVVIDDDGDGKLSTCDINTNKVPDDADAASCALLVSAGQDCSSVNATSTQTSDIKIQGKSGTYRGLTITITIKGTQTATCPSTYKKLLYRDSTGIFWVATTLSGENCTDIDSNTWPCPIEQNSIPLDLVSTIDTSLTNAINSLGNAIPTTTGTDVQDSINKIKSEKCCTEPGEDPNNVSTCTCTSSEIANYLQTIKK